jgi:hypothetical protein
LRRDDILPARSACDDVERLIRDARNRNTGHAAALIGMFIGSVLEDSFNIAWGFLEKSGELGPADASANILMDSIERQIRTGERRKLMLANRAISAYRERAASAGVCPRTGQVIWIN